jgi:hypothetical protein
MVKIQTEVIVQLDLLDKDVEISFSDSLCVSLDCDFCQRTDRTVAFGRHMVTSCHPGGSASKDQVGVHPPYPGRLVDRKTTRTDDYVRAVYTLEHETAQFLDRKYKRRVWCGHPTWGRVSYTMKCSKCVSEVGDSTQSNTGRPNKHCCRNCGHLLCVEREEMPIFRWRCISSADEANTWKIVPARFPRDLTAIRDELSRTAM